MTVQDAQPHPKAEPVSPRVIAISSGKGGVGKSSISVNLGISLAKKGAKVCLLDADTGLANANILLGISPQFSLEHVLYGAKAIEEILLDGPHGMKIIPGANGISECVSLHPRQQLRLTRELARIESDFDYLLIDTAAGIADTTLDFVNAAQHTLIVITPEPTSLTDAFSLIKLLKRRRSKTRFQVVVNMCSSNNQAKEVFHRFAAAVEKYIGLKAQYLGCILRDESMRAAVALQNPVAMFPDSDPSSRRFMILAEKLEMNTASPTTTPSFSAYWQRQFRQQREQGPQPSIEPVAKENEQLSEQDKKAREDREYLQELRSRLLLLIEQGHAEQGLLGDLLQKSVAAFQQRFGHSAMDIGQLLDQIVASPERDDQLLRSLAERLRPWAISADPAPGSLFGPSPVASGADGQELLPEPSPLPANSASSSETEAECSPAALGSVQDDIGDGEELIAVRPARIHHYDSTRFGSQDHLLDVLRRPQSGSKPLQELLDSLL